MTTTVEPSTAAPSPAVPRATETAPTTAPSTPSTPADRSGRIGTALLWVATVSVAIVGTIGFASSYSELRALAEAKGFGEQMARLVPIGLDFGIIAMLALDLYMLRLQRSWVLPRLLAHALALATVALNATAGGPVLDDPQRALMHGIMPVLFIVGIEAARRIVIRAVRLETGHDSDGIPLHRWLLSPLATPAMYRRMRLWGITSYTEAVRLEQQRSVYRVMLDRRYGTWRKAPSDARLPFSMARYGLSVEEALRLPEEQESAERERAEAAEARRLDAERAQEQRAAAAEIERLRTETELAEARHHTAARVGSAEAEAEATRAEAEAAARARSAAARRRAEAEARAAEVERAAVETAEAAEARARAAEAEAAEAEAARRAAEDAAEAARLAAEAEAQRERAAASEASTARDARAAAEAAEAAAGARARAAELERRAAEAEDYARLSPSERAARRVARMVLTDAGGDPEALPLAAIEAALGVSRSTASDRRRDAAELIARGYSLNHI